MDSVGITVEGLNEFRKRLRSMESSFPRMLRVAHNEAAELVVGPAQAAVPRDSGAAADSIRAGSSQTQTRVKAGSKKIPYYAWLDFGGTAGRATRQFRKRGRYIYLQYFKVRDSGQFVEVLTAALEKVAKEAGIDVE